MLESGVAHIVWGEGTITAGGFSIRTQMKKDVGQNSQYPTVT